MNDLAQALRGLLSYADDAPAPDHPHHFKGEPNYVLEDTAHGKRWHLAHPDPDKLIGHLDDHIEGVARGPLTVFGWERQPHDGSRFPGLDAEESAIHANVWGVANPDELKRRLTAGHPLLQDAQMRCNLEEGDTDWDSVIQDLEYDHGGDISADRYGVISREEEIEDEDENVKIHTTYWNGMQGEWQHEPHTNYNSPKAVVHLSHPLIGTMTRSIHENYEGDGYKAASQDYWARDTTKGKSGNPDVLGLSGLLYQSQFEAYRAADCEQVKVHANITVGGYAWAKHGFEPDDLDDLRERVQDQLDSLHSDYGQDAGDPFDPDSDYDVDSPTATAFTETHDLDPLTATDEEMQDAADNSPDHYLRDLKDYADASRKAGRALNDREYDAHVWDRVMRSGTGGYHHDPADFDGPTEVKKVLEDRDDDIDRQKGYAERRQEQYRLHAESIAEVNAFRAANPDRHAWVDERLASIPGEARNPVAANYTHAYDTVLPDLSQRAGVEARRTDLTLHPDLLPELRQDPETNAADIERLTRLDPHIPDAKARIETLAQEHADHNYRLQLHQQYLTKAGKHILASQGHGTLMAELEKHPTLDSYLAEKSKGGLSESELRDLAHNEDRLDGLSPAMLADPHFALIATRVKAMRARMTPTTLSPEELQTHAERYAQAEALLKGELQPNPAPEPYSGPEKTTGAMDDAIIRHFITETGWSPGDSSGPFNDEKLEELKDEVEGIHSAHDLAGFEVPDDIGVPKEDRKAGKDGLLGTDWYGSYDLSRRSGGDAYRAGKISAEHVTTTPVSAPVAGPPDPLKKALGGKRVEDFDSPTALASHLARNGRTVTDEEREAATRAWNTRMNHDPDGDETTFNRIATPAGQATGALLHPTPTDFDLPGEVIAHAEIAQGRLLTADEIHAAARHFHVQTGNGLHPLDKTVAHTPETAYARQGRPPTFGQARSVTRRQDLRELAERHLDETTRETDAQVWQSTYGERHPRSIPVASTGVAQRVGHRNALQDAGHDPTQGLIYSLQRQYERHHLLGTLPTPESEAWERWGGIPGTTAAPDPAGNAFDTGFRPRMVENRRAQADRYPLDERPGDEAHLVRRVGIAQRARGQDRGSTGFNSRIPDPTWQRLAHQAVTGQHEATPDLTEAHIRAQGAELGLPADVIEDAVAHQRRSTK